MTAYNSNYLTDRGGPGTFRGTNYQLEWAVFYVLQQMCRGFPVPLGKVRLSIEYQGSATSAVPWDISVAPPDELFEVKLHPTKQHVLEWVGRARRSFEASQMKQFTLVCSRYGGTVFEALTRLQRVAQQAQDAEVFAATVSAKEPFRSLISALGNQAFAILPKLHVRNDPQTSIREQIPTLCAFLANSHGKQLEDFLFHELAKMGENRETRTFRELVEAAREFGISIKTSESLELIGISQKERELVAICQVCPHPLPIEVLAGGFQMDQPAIETGFQRLQERGLMESTASGWSPSPLLNRTHHQGLVYSVVLRRLLDFIEQYRHDAAGKDQVLNAVALAESCFGSAPHTCAKVFMTTEKILKSRGDKQLVLKVAELALDAAAHSGPNRGDDVLRAEAHALICGRSWVLQRIGRLAEALAAAETSLNKGKLINWQRNTAYCLKCIGRLHRLLAAQEPETRHVHLETSVSYIRGAIDLFANSSEFGASHPEVGDCYSLLGRTLLDQRRLREVAQAVSTAFDLITDESSKDYLDLIILEGDLEFAQGDIAAAIRHYDEVISSASASDTEINEIRGRACMARGRALKERANREGRSSQLSAAIVRSFMEASAIFEKLGEILPASEAKLEAMFEEGRVPPALHGVIGSESPPVIVTAVELHEARLSARKKAIGRRADPGKPYWDQLLRESRLGVARKQIEW